MIIRSAQIMEYHSEVQFTAQLGELKYTFIADKSNDSMGVWNAICDIREKIANSDSQLVRDKILGIFDGITDFETWTEVIEELS